MTMWDSGLPPQLTGGQKTVRRHKNGRDSGGSVDGGLGFQAHFIGPEALVDPEVAEEQPERKPEGVQLSLDWAGFTFHPVKSDVMEGEKWQGEDGGLESPLVFRDKVMLAASVALGCELGDWVYLDSGLNGYRRSFIGPEGARILFDPVDRDDFNVTFPGKACGLISEERMRSWLRFAVANRVVAKRLDTDIDDYTRAVLPGQVLEELKGPNAVTHAKKVLVQQGFQVGTDDMTGITVYLGAPSARQRLRVYDKGLESGGEVDCIRWELQARDEAAQTLLIRLVEQDWGSVLTSRLVSFLDFRDPESHSDVEKRTRLPWFQALVGTAEKASAYLPKAARTVDQVIGWIRSGVGTSLAVAVDHWKRDKTLKGDFLAPLMDIVRDGELRFKPKHRAMLIRAGAPG